MGSVLWKPLPAVGRGAQAVRKRPQRRRPLFAGRVAWVRVAAGVALAVAGTMSAKFLFEWVLDVSGGHLATTDELQDRIIIWEVKALALLLGGALAGATTPNGLKQGLCVGLGASAILCGAQMRLTDRWLLFITLTCISAFSLSLLGGWFGSQLFPPIVKFKRSRDLGPA
jgi:hypothetical protein